MQLRRGHARNATGIGSSLHGDFLINRHLDQPTFQAWISGEENIFQFSISSRPRAGNRFSPTKEPIQAFVYQEPVIVRASSR
jgi:hypothetical protein